MGQDFEALLILLRFVIILSFAVGVVLVAANRKKSEVILGGLLVVIGVIVFAIPF